MLSLSPALKRYMSIAFFAAIVFFGAKTCAVESAECDLVFKLRQEPASGLQDLEVHLLDIETGDYLGRFTSRYERGSVLGRWPLVVSAGDYIVEGELRGTSGTVAFSKQVSLVDGEAISVYLEY